MLSEQILSSQRQLLDAYAQHLQAVCGATIGTSQLFRWHVLAFLATRYGSRRPRLEALKPRDVIGYVMGLSPGWKPNTRKSAVTALRSFLRWLQMHGLCTSTLVNSVPTVSAKNSSGLPVFMTSEQLAVFLSSFDQSRAAGLRGYAIALCMSSLGLRVSEVARLTLDDFNWHEGTVQITVPKCRRKNLLPLPHGTGKAIVAYIRKGRPETNARHIFVRHILPHKGISKGAMRDIIRQAFNAADLEIPSKGTRVLRHTAATSMIRAGATIKEISDVLGHCSINTTSIYAKVDVSALSEVALPWPKEVL